MNHILKGIDVKKFSSNSAVSFNSVVPKAFSAQKPKYQAMSTPKQPCPKCHCEIGELLYCTKLIKNEYFCPTCSIKIQGKCKTCGTWLTVVESMCSKCGTKNPFFCEPKD
jgi:hypothetical protein